MRVLKTKRQCIISICAAALVVLVTALTGCVGMPDGHWAAEETPEPTAVLTTAPTPTQVPTEVPTAEPTATPEPAEARLMLVGDLMCLGKQQTAAIAQGRQTGRTYDFRPTFKYVKEIFSKADFVVGNVETVLSDSSPYSSSISRMNGMPYCNGPSTYLNALIDAGFDALVCANNHNCDAGTLGVEETIAAIEEKNIPYIGLYENEETPHYIIIDVNGIKIGLLAYTATCNDLEGPVLDDGKGYMLSFYSEEAVKRDVGAARAAGAEFIIAYNHWGNEFTHEPNDSVKMRAKQMADAGVDIIAGSHPHAIQPVVWLTAADGRAVLCAYSLGNFASSMSKDMSKNTFILDVAISRKADGRVSIDSRNMLPCRTIADLYTEKYVIVPTSAEGLPGNIMMELAEAETEIRSNLGLE